MPFKYLPLILFIYLIQATTKRKFHLPPSPFFDWLLFLLVFSSLMFFIFNLSSHFIIILIILSILISLIIIIILTWFTKSYVNVAYSIIRYYTILHDVIISMLSWSALSTQEDGTFRQILHSNECLNNKSDADLFQKHEPPGWNLDHHRSFDGYLGVNPGG